MRMKEKIKAQVAQGQALMKTLEAEGKTPEQISAIIRKQGYLAPVLSKLLHTSGHDLAPTTSVEDRELAEATIDETKTAKKPIREKEIEDASWFHNLLHDVGKYVYHAMVQYVKWTPEDMNSYEHARKTIMDYIDNIRKLIEDAGKIQQLEDDNERMGIDIERSQAVMNLLVSRVKMLKWYNDMLIGVMTPEIRLRALNQMMAASAISVMPEGMAKAQAEVTANA